MKTPSHTAVALILLSSPAWSQLSSYTSSGNGVWDSGINWSNGVPNGAGHNAFLGPSANAENTRVTLGSNVSLDGALITDGMHVDTNGHALTITEAIPAAGLKIIGSNMVDDEARPSQLILDPYFIFNNTLDAALLANDISVEGGGRIYLSEEGARAVVTGNLNIDSESSVEGYGTITFSGENSLNNNGTIATENGTTLHLRHLSVFGGLNLDGSDRDGILSAAQGHSKIIVEGIIEGDSFDGEIEIGTNSDVHFHNAPIFGAAESASIMIDSRHPLPGTLKVDDGQTVWLRLASTLTSKGTGVIEGNLRLTGGPTVEVVDVINSKLTVTGDSKLNGGLVKVGGDLEFAGGVSESENVAFLMEGGELSAGVPSTIFLKGDKTEDRLTGHGLWRCGIHNDTLIKASGGLLTIDTTGHSADIDGPSDLGEVQAASGDLTFIQPVAVTHFDSKMLIANGHTLDLDVSKWSFSNTSELTMGGDHQGGILKAETDLTFEGNTMVTLDSEIHASGTFSPSSETFITSSQLLLTDNSSIEIEQGAEFTGSGTLKVAQGSSLNFDLTNTVDCKLTNAGFMTVNENATGILTLNDTFALEGFGTVEMNIKGSSQSPNYDRIAVNGLLKPNGTVRVKFDYPAASLGDTWRIIKADEVEGSLANFEFSGVPAGMALIPYTTEDGIYVKLSPWSLTYLEWANQKGLMLANLGKFQDPDGDNLSNALEMLVGGDPLTAEPHLHPVPGIVEVEGKRYLTLSFFQANHALNSDLNETFEKSIDLQNWKNADLLEHEAIHYPEDCKYYHTLRLPTPISSNIRTFLRIAFP